MTPGPRPAPDGALLRPDVCVVGAGSGGLTVAAACAAFGVSVVLIERARMGGDCLNVGCVPSKALIAAGRAAEAVRRAPAFGIEAGAPVADFARVFDHVQGVIDAIAPNDSVERFERLGVRVIGGHARFLDPRTIEAGGQRIAARRFVLATGSSPRVPAIEGLGDVPFLTNETIFAQRAAPAHLLVLGGGPVGLELGQAHRRLGCRVTVIEAGRALGREDADLSAVVLARLRTEGVAVLEATRVVRAGLGAGPQDIRLEVEAADGGRRTIAGSHLLVATGRTPNLAGLGLEAAGIAAGTEGIVVGRDLRTSNPRVYAIGDAVGGPQFTHRANRQAELVVRAILFRLRIRDDPRSLPRVTFTDPELAQIGPSEAELRAEGADPTVLRWPFAENDRAQTARATEGFVKILAGRRGRLLGAGVVGEGAGEIANLFSLALSQTMDVGDLRAFVSPYPTVSEVGKRAAAAYFHPYAKRGFVRGLVRLLARLG